MSLNPARFYERGFCSINIKVQKNGHIKCDNFQHRKQLDTFDKGLAVKNVGGCRYENDKKYCNVINQVCYVYEGGRRSDVY